MDVDTFTDLLTKKQNGANAIPGNKFAGSQRKLNRIAIIDPAYGKIGNPKVTFEGESDVTAQTFAVMEGYQPLPSDRVIMLPVGTTYVILGPVQNDITIPVVTAGPLSYYEPWVNVPLTSFQNSWREYEGGFTYGPARYMVDAKGKVRLGGLIAAGGTVNNVIFQLPPALVPDFTLSFQVQAAGSSGAATAEVRIDTSGNVRLYSLQFTGSSNAYISLDSIAFFPASRGIQWTYPSLVGVWTAYTASGGCAPRYFVDCDNIVHWSGMAAGGTTNIVALTPTIQPDVGEEIFSCACNGGGVRIDVEANGVNEMFVSSYDPGGGNNTYVSLEGIEYANQFNTLFWHKAASAFAYVNSWAAYGSIFSVPRWSVDSANVVRWSGLVASGTAATAITATIPYQFTSAYRIITNCIDNSYASRLDLPPTQAAPNMNSSRGPSPYNAFVSLGNLIYFADYANKFT